MKQAKRGDVIREVVSRTCRCPVHDRDRLGDDLHLDAATVLELLAALELALRTELQNIALIHELTVGDLVRILTPSPLGASRP